MPLPIRVLPLHRGDRARLESLVRSRTTPQRVVERARIVLGSAAGDSGSTICGDVGVSRPTVTLWLDRYEAGGLAALRADRPRSGRPKRITLAEEEAIVRRTTQTPPPAGRGTHWSTRLMAEVTGFHHSTIARIWKAHGLRPPPGPAVQVVDRPRLRGKTPRCRRVVPAAARAGDRLLVG